MKEMNYKQKFGYTFLGAVIMLTGICVGSIVSPPLIAQRNGVFEEIQCSKLTVLHKSGKEAIVLEAHAPGASIRIRDWLGKRAVFIHGGLKELGNGIIISDKVENPGILIGSDDMENDMVVFDNLGVEAVALHSGKQGNSVRVRDKEDIPVVVLYSGELQNIAEVRDKAGGAVLLRSGGILESLGIGPTISVVDKAGQIMWQAP